ncbi:MAG TPA: GtrA family protein [Anaerolineaceae bacterium]|jgi:putative flippase GtrA|nr:GtrA family protein [Anaerolineaceae bacterium]HQL92761.1 GtrA family protein [Anaerolineaceae bacterium]
MPTENQNISETQATKANQETSGSQDAPLKSRESLIQAIKFTLLSISAAGIEAVSFIILERLTTLPYDIKHVISVVLSVLWNFTLNRRYTFKSANNVPIAMLKVGLFYAFFIPLTAWLGKLADGAGVNEYIIKGSTMVLNFVGEFLWWKFIVFRGSENTNALAKKKQETNNETD